MANNLEYILRLKDQFSKTMQGAANQVKGLDGKMNSLKSRLNGMGSMIAGAFAVGSVVSFGKAVLESLKNYEYFHASLKVLLFGNEKAANALEKQLISLAKTTPFSLVDVQQGSKQLLAYSFAASTIVENMKMLGDISSGVGKPLGELVYLYGTLKTQGRAFTKDINQFTTAGINLLPQLAKQFKVTDAEVMKLVQDGKVGFKEVEKAFKAMTSEGGQFFGMMAVQSKTVGGQLSMLGDSWEQLKVKIGQSQTGIIASTTSWLNNMLDGINRGIDAMNLLDKAFKGTESSQYGFFQKYPLHYWQQLTGLAGLKPIEGSYTEMRQYGAGMQKNLGETSKDRLSAATNNATISNMIKGIFADKTMSAIEKNRRVGVLQEIRKQNLEAMSMFGLKENKSQIEGAGGVDGGKGTKSLGTGTEVTGQRPQAINININELVHELNIQTTNLTEGAGRMKELVSKALLETVNDINLIAMA
jgi:tape measure domain-containing protein